MNYKLYHHFARPTDSLVPIPARMARKPPQHFKIVICCYLCRNTDTQHYQRFVTVTLNEGKRKSTWTISRRFSRTVTGFRILLTSIRSCSYNLFTTFAASELLAAAAAAASELWRHWSLYDVIVCSMVAPPVNWLADRRRDCSKILEWRMRII